MKWSQTGWLYWEGSSRVWLATYLAAINSVIANTMGSKISTAAELQALILSYKLADQSFCFRPPAWDFDVIFLFSEDYFKNLVHVTLKTVFLLALATARISEIHGLEVNRVCFERQHHEKVFSSPRTSFQENQIFYSQSLHSPWSWIPRTVKTFPCALFRLYVFIWKPQQLYDVLARDCSSCYPLGRQQNFQELWCTFGYYAQLSSRQTPSQGYTFQPPSYTRLRQLHLRWWC